MGLFSFTRLTVERQRRVGEAVAPLLKPKGKGKVGPGVPVATRAAEFASAHDALAGVSLLPKLAVDNAADRTYAGAFNTLNGIVQTFSDPLVPLADGAQRRLDAARGLSALAFPAGVRFLSKPMGTQYEAMRGVVRALRSEKATADVKALGFGDTVAHLEATLAPYGVAVTSADGADVEKLSDAWHLAFSNLAAALIGSLSESDPRRAGVLGAYQKELDAQSEVIAARTRRRKKAAPAPTP